MSRAKHIDNDESMKSSSIAPPRLPGSRSNSLRQRSLPINRRSTGYIRDQEVQSFLSEFNNLCKQCEENDTPEGWISVRQFLRDHLDDIDKLETPRFQRSFMRDIDVFLRQVDYMIRDKHLTKAILPLPQWLIDHIVMNSNFQLYLNKRVCLIGPATTLCVEISALVLTAYWLYTLVESYKSSKVPFENVTFLWWRLFAISAANGIGQIMAFAAVVDGGKWLAHFRNLSNVLMILMTLSVLMALAKTGVLLNCTPLFTFTTHYDGNSSVPTWTKVWLEDDSGGGGGGESCPESFIDVSFETSSAIFFFALAIMAYVTNFNTRMAGVIGGIFSAMPTVAVGFGALALFAFTFALIFAILQQISVNRTLFEATGPMVYPEELTVCHEIGEPCLHSLAEKMFGIYDSLSFGDISRFSIVDLDTTSEKAFFIVMVHIIFFLLVNAIGFLLAFNIYDRGTYVDFWNRRFLLIQRYDAIRDAMVWCFCFFSRKQRNNDELLPSSSWMPMGDFLANSWEKLMAFYQKLDQRSSWADQFGVHVGRVVIALVVIPVWFLIGCASAGIFWPYQMRSFLLAINPNDSSLCNVNMWDVASREVHAVSEGRGLGKMNRSAASLQSQHSHLEESATLREEMSKMSRQMTELARRNEVLVLELTRKNEELVLELTRKNEALELLLTSKNEALESFVKDSLREILSEVRQKKHQYTVL